MHQFLMPITIVVIYLKWDGPNRCVTTRPARRLPVTFPIVVSTSHYWITLCFRGHCFCCSQIWRTRHRRILIFTRSNLMDSKGCQAFKKHICHILKPFLWTNKYRQNREVKGHLSAIISRPFLQCGNSSMAVDTCFGSTNLRCNSLSRYGPNLN